MANFFHDNFMLQNNNVNVNNSHVNHDVFVIDLNNFNNHSDNGDYDNISLLQTLLNHQQHPHHHHHQQQQHQLQPLQNYHHLNNSTSINHQIVATNILNDEFNCFNVTELEAVPNHLIQWFLITIYSLTSLLALIGNLTVIIVEMYGKESAHNIRKYLINLAISDIIIGVLCVPFTYTDFMLGQWIFPHWLCPTAQFVQLLSVFVTSLTLTFIGIERYMATLHPFSPIHHWLESHTNIILIATWILGSAYAYIPFENTATRAFSLPNNNETIYYECTYDNDVTIIKLRIFMASNILLTFILPLFVLIFSYSAIMRKLISDERRFRKSLSSSKTKHHNETIKSNDDNNNNNSIRDNRTSPPQSTNFGVKFKYKHVNNNQQRSVISKYGDDNTDDFNSIQSINDDNGNGDGDPPNNQKPTINHCRFKQQQPRKCLCLNQPNKTIIYDNDDHKIIGGGGGGGTPNGHCQCTTNIDSNNKNNRLNTMNQTSILSSTLSLSSSVGSSTTTSPPHSASISPIIVNNKCDNHRNRINNDRNDCNDYVDNYDDNLQHQQHRHHHHQQPTTPSTATTTITMTPIICNNSTNQPPPQQFNTGQIDLRKSTPFNHRSKTIKMMFTVILLYGICWMPIKLYQFLNDYGIISYCTEHELYAMVTLYFICHWMAMANSFVNPIIYSFMSKSFRNDFSKISQTFSKNINHLSIKTSLTQV